MQPPLRLPSAIKQIKKGAPTTKSLSCRPPPPAPPLCATPLTGRLGSQRHRAASRRSLHTRKGQHFILSRYLPSFLIRRNSMSAVGCMRRCRAQLCVYAQLNLWCRHGLCVRPCLMMQCEPAYSSSTAVLVQAQTLLRQVLGCAKACPASPDNHHLFLACTITSACGACGAAERSGLRC